MLPQFPLDITPLTPSTKSLPKEEQPKEQPKEDHKKIVLDFVRFNLNFNASKEIFSSCKDVITWFKDYLKSKGLDFFPSMKKTLYEIIE